MELRSMDKTKSNIKEKAPVRYFIDYEKKANPYDLGKEFFGKCGSGKGDLSASYKRAIEGNRQEFLDLFQTWTDADLAEFNQVTEDFERINEEEPKKLKTKNSWTR
jgi:hypothetical protein